MGKLFRGHGRKYHEPISASPSICYPHPPPEVCHHSRLAISPTGMFWVMVISDTALCRWYWRGIQHGWDWFCARLGHSPRLQYSVHYVILRNEGKGGGSRTMSLTRLTSLPNVWTTHRFMKLPYATVRCVEYFTSPVCWWVCKYG